MDDFLRFIAQKVKTFPMHVDIYYSHVMDWCITVTRRGYARHYPESEHDGDDAVLCRVQDCDIALCFAKAHVEVKEWMSRFLGGY